MKCDKKDLGKLLNISLNAVKCLEKRNKLENRLNLIGYKLLSKDKEGNKNYYTIEKTKDYDFITREYGVKKTDNFISYFHKRTSEKPQTAESLAAESKVSKKTVSKWDNKLQDKKILSKDGFYYFKVDKETQELSEISEEEYKSFWKNKAYLSAFKKLQERYLKGEISLTELQLSTADVAAIITTIENKYCFKIKKYKVNTENKLYLETKKIVDNILNVVP